ncbi:MAG: hypothetical protein JW779_15700 [Candidatus Thorarchaeota archaeon]|nr:hypothetical protein [Candidatus Thorarchaeota archaeon]
MQEHGLSKILIAFLFVLTLLGISSNYIANYVFAETLVELDTIYALRSLNVELHDGYAEYFEDPPDIIAPANTEWAPIPPEFKIEKGGNRLSLYDEAVMLEDGTCWIEAETTVNCQCIGVQLWGATDGGWARVLIDEAEVWTGSTYSSGNDSPWGVFAKYLEACELSAGTHTIRVENMGTSGIGGGTEVIVIFFGMREVTSNIAPETESSQEPSSESIPSENEPPVQPTSGFADLAGDCNSDGVLNVNDALIALKMAVGKIDENLVADLNHDGTVSSIDARKILRISLGLEILE